MMLLLLNNINNDNRPNSNRPVHSHAQMWIGLVLRHDQWKVYAKPRCRIRIRASLEKMKNFFSLNSYNRLTSTPAPHENIHWII